MKNRQSHKFTNSQMINATALFFSLFFLASAVAAALYTGEFGSVFYDWYLIMISPCPLVTDYLSIGGLGSAMLNAGACGMVCTGNPMQIPWQDFFWLWHTAFMG